MNLTTLFSAREIATGRFLFVSLVPTYAAAVWLLALGWAGAPGRLNFTTAWHTAAGLHVGEALLIGLLVTLLALLTHPLQFSMVRVLEGYGWPGWLAAPGKRYHRRRRRSMVPVPTKSPTTAADLLIDFRRRRQYPPEDLVRPTLLGNVLAASEDTAGLPYGFDAVIAWPRIYPVLSNETRAVVDDRRIQLDVAARMTITAGVVTAVSAALLASSGWWWWLTAIPAALAVLAYAASVQAAVAFGESLHVAFDLHRFNLTDTLRMPRPTTMADEKPSNEKLCRLWRGEVQTIDVPYQQPSS